MYTTRILLACFLLSGLISRAQDLDPVSVTASLTREKVSQTGRNIQIISGERLKNLPAHSVDELLRYLPGVEVQSRGPLGSQADIVIRGGTFQQVLVLLDGLRVNDPNTGHFTANVPVAPSEIARIEILKGASSAVYGSEAVGGVIHIITKSFAAGFDKKETSVAGKLTAGAYGLAALDAALLQNSRNTNWSIGVLSNNTSGQPQRGTHGSVYAQTVSASVSQQLAASWVLRLRATYDRRRFSAQNFYTNFTSDTASERLSAYWTQLALEHNAKNHQLSLQAGFKHLEDEYQFNSVGVPNQSTSTLLQLRLTDDWKAGRFTSVVSGVQAMRRTIESNDRGAHQLDQLAFFSLLRQEIGSHAMVVPALRFEKTEGLNWELVPQLSLSYKAGAVVFRASGGKTIRDADFTERYNNYQKALVTSGRIGNPELSAERSFSYEGGVDLFLTNALRLSGTYFRREQRKVIDYVVTPYADMPRKTNLSPTGTYALAKNISTVNTAGWEMDLNFHHQFDSSQSIWMTAGLTLADSKGNEATPSLYISSHARTLINFNITYTVSRFLFTVNGIYKHRRPQPGTAVILPVEASYFVMNAQAELALIKQRLSVFAEADNIFDRTYTDLLGARMPGRWLMGGIKISLSKMR